jgi:hypothetical protein
MAEANAIPMKLLPTGAALCADVRGCLAISTTPAL